MDWKSLGWQLLSAVLVVVIPIIVKALVPFLTAKAKELIQKVDDDSVEKVLNRAIEIVADAVDYVSQTFVDDLRANGEFTNVQYKEAFTKAANRVKDLLSDETKEVIEKNFGDLDLWIETKVEAYILRQKVGEGVLYDAVIDE